MLRIHTRRRDIRKGLIDGDLLYIGRLVSDHIHDLGRELSVAFMTTVSPYGIGAKAHRGGGSHGTAHAEGTSLIGTGGDHAMPISIAADDHGLASPLRMVQLFNGSEERVQVQQHDSPPRPRSEEFPHHMGTLRIFHGS